MRLDIKNLSYSYNGKEDVFNNINFSLEKGDILSILGPNGVGKSTLLNCVSLLLKPKTGSVIYGNKDLTKLSYKEVSRYIGYVQQIHIPKYNYKVRDYILMGRAPHLGLFERPRKIDYEIVDKVIKMLNIDNIKDSEYTHISGGEQQKANIARVLVQNPEIIILDEPTAHLDYGSQMDIIRLIKKLSDQGFIVIHTTHDPNQVFALENYVAILYKEKFAFGKAMDIIDEGSLSEIYNNNIEIIDLDKGKRKICTIKNW